ncbi:tyrosine-type recombinase/integrase [Candidatus Marimicrobium litorale]|uniref:Site-specific integrase n=1 Tax=Candidatus Marimicrobium litorale TaxID=2518991 RepID=A0ABT3T272_9GAMM|nr:site-specific integrase [Candidatus Marimicrobium litorale]MCX2976360.1 site-specific integrase [Candidatus Marimicrobium litorale]
MAQIYKRGDRWRAVIRMKGHPSKSKSFGLKREAEAWAAEEETRVNQGGASSTKKQTLSWLIDQYLDERDINEYDTEVLEWWRGKLGGVRVTELYQGDFKTARKSMMKLKVVTGPNKGELIAPATVNNRMAIISAVFSYAEDEHSALMKNRAHPIRGIRRLKVPPPRDPYKRGWDEEARELLLAECGALTVKRGGSNPVHEPALLMLVKMALASGARAGELLSLRWRDIDFDEGVAILYDTKNGDDRMIPLKDCIEDLLEWKTLRARGSTEREQQNDLVLYNTFSGKPYNYRQHWQKVMRVWMKKTGITNFRYHDLRHVAGTEWIRQGFDSMTVGKGLGHRSPASTKRYVHHSSEMIGKLGVSGKSG